MDLGRLIAALLPAVLFGCGGDEPVLPSEAPLVRYTEERAECDDRNPLRNAYFGDLHVHTRLSFDAFFWETRADPAAAYRFAQGDPIDIPPTGADGSPSQRVQLERPLDFAAVTDHAEFLGEVLTCTEPDRPGHDSEFCGSFRNPDDASAFAALGAQLTANPTLREPPGRLVCAEEDCRDITVTAWERIREATEAAYDRTSACSFTTLHGWEWSANTDTRNLHRNVIFRNSSVPDRPVSYYDAFTPERLWVELIAGCEAAGDDCDVLAIPHNSNLSNGAMFRAVYPGASTRDEEAVVAALRARMEPLVETFQHKGNSECMTLLPGILGQPDELCAVEEFRSNPFGFRETEAAPDCGDDLGTLGIVNGGCVSSRDFVRGALLLGLGEERRIGVNPMRFGFIGSTDTHNATIGATEEDAYAGHIGNVEATPEGRLGAGFAQPSGIIGNPGGLAGVWAVENSRDGIFEALARREAFSTSGTRIAPRFFGGWEYEAGLCDDPTMLTRADAGGVPMGSVLPERADTAAAPRFLVAALRDPSERAAPLERLQVIKGLLDANDRQRYRVYDVAGDARGEVDLDTCERTGRPGKSSLCTVWTDPDFDPTEPAFYYLRVVEDPSCRWSHRQCLALPEGNRPEGCTDPRVPKTIQEMAWSSPIWYSPAAP